MINLSEVTCHFDLPIMQVLQGSESLFMDRFMFILTCAVTWIPLYISLLYLIIRNNETMKQIALILFFSILTIAISDYVIDVLVKPIVMRYRPSQDPYFKYTIDVVNGYRGGAYGFFSAHASNTMSLALFFCLIIRSRLLWFVLMLWSLINCYTRIYLGVHYPSDVAVGLVWGSIVGVFTYSLYAYIIKKTGLKRKFISDQYTTSGYAFRDNYIVAIIVVMTLLYAVFRSMFQI